MRLAVAACPPMVSSWSVVWRCARPLDESRRHGGSSSGRGYVGGAGHQLRRSEFIYACPNAFYADDMLTAAR